MKRLIIPIISLWFAACAPENPQQPDTITLNPPLSVEISHFNNRITIEIESYNTSQNSPDFAGYNIYFAEIPFASAIFSNVILSKDYLDLPSLRTVPSDSIQKFTFTLQDTITYTNKNGGIKQSRSIDLHSDYYFMIRAWDERKMQESLQQNIYAVKPSYKILSNAAVENTVWSYENFSVIIYSNSIEPQAGTTLRSAGWLADWESQRFAPASNYTSQSWPIIEGQVFFAYCAGSYAKVQILSRSNTSRIVNFSYQRLGTDL